MVGEFGLGSSALAEESHIYPESNGHDEFKGSVRKKIKLSLPHNYQREDLNPFQQASPLGLTLNKTPSFLNLLETVLSQTKTKRDTTSSPSTRPRKEANTNDFSGHQHGSEKLKASNFPALSIKIGSFEKSSRYEEELIAKCYYAKKKIVWEVLEGPMKSKMEIQWSDIVAIRATILGNEPGILELELNTPPLFFKETNPQPRKHTLWQQTSDFTGGQALKCRRHIVHFPSGTLDKHYEKLLQCDCRLLELSQKPFPSGQFPYFQHNLYRHTISFGTELGHQHVGVNHDMFNNQGEENWKKDENVYVTENHIEGLPTTIASETYGWIDPNIFFDIKNLLRSNMQLTCPDNGDILAASSSMGSFVDSPDGLNNMGIDYQENIQEKIGDSWTSKSFEYNNSMINSVPLQVSEDNFITTNYYYQYGLSNAKVEQYEPLDTNYVDYQWR